MIRNLRAILGLLTIIGLGAGPVVAMPRGDLGVARAGSVASAPSGCSSSYYNPNGGQGLSYQLCTAAFATYGNGWTYGDQFEVSSTNYYSAMQGFNGTILNWRYPSTGCGAAPVCGYSRVQLGGIYSTDGDTGNKGPPVQYSAMQELLSEIDVTITPVTGTIASTTILCEYYSSTSSTSVQTGRTKEVAFWPRYSTGTGSADAFWNATPSVGSFTDRYGYSWTVHRSSTSSYYFARRTDGTQMDKAFLDIKAYVNFLIDQGALSPSEYIHGYACGVEQTGHQASARVNHFTFVKR